MLSWPKPCKPPIKGIIQVSQTWAHGVQLSAFNKATQIPRWHAACIKVTTIKDTKIESKTNHLSRKHWHFCRYLACEASHIASYLAAAKYECSKTLLKVWCEAREESNENLNCEVHSEESLCDNKVYLSHQEWKLSEILKFLIGKAWKSCKKKNVLGVSKSSQTQTGPSYRFAGVSNLYAAFTLMHLTRLTRQSRNHFLKTSLAE